MKHVVSAAPRHRRVLVTGFGAFPGTRTNPTEAILARLARSGGRLARLGITLDCLRLPVAYAEIEPALRRVADVCRPDAVLHLGLAARRRCLCVETRAINRAGALHPDASRRLPKSQTLVPGGPARLAATYPSARILAAIRATGLPARASIDAGDYVCNATLYLSLSARIAPRVGFLHVPRVRTNGPPGRTTTRKPTIEALAGAALAAVIVLGRQDASTAAPFFGPRNTRRMAARISTSRAPAADA